MTTPVIDLKEVSLRLGEGASSVHVLKGVSLSVERGESTAIVGPSGSGKSTLLMVIAGLERVDSGSVRIAGERIDQLGEDAIAAFRGKMIGIVFQSFHLIPNMTALENVAVPLELAGRDDAFAVAERELDAVGLKERLTHYPGELSGGEQQRVAIARALAPEPAIMIADEPTGNLDQATGRQIADLLFSTARERGTTLVLVTHDPMLAARCDRQVAMRSGRIETAAPEALAAV
ncbi:ABC transporter ATP-binding protein [Chelativorans sp.]|uniref:ABC transporter ATP-binding protein n=1 Tax=Chelativorans sp. TaxID=2203393 RepID=UPI0028112C6F|nr:ABC transporter ATP-binding protein [Chelativorans sp.]